MHEIGQRMKELRESAHLSQMEIAQLAQSNQTTIAKTETGKTVPSLKLLLWWANYFDVSLDYVCCRTDRPQGIPYECKPKNATQSADLRDFVDMCFDPKSPMSVRLKETLLAMMEEGSK